MRRGAAWAVPILLLVTGCSFGRTPAAPATVTVTTTATPASPATGTASATAVATPTPQVATLQSAFEDVKSGVVRLEVTGCDGAAVGSGFAISDTLLVTAAHVVSGGQVVEVIQGTQATAGTVVGIDEETDVALVRTATPLSGAVLAFSGTEPRVGDAVATIGYPEGDPITLHTGTVNALGRKAVIEGIARHDLLELDAAATHGDSGGPVIRADGGVVGVFDAVPDGEQGGRLAVSSGTAQPLVEAWGEDPEPTTYQDCTATIDLDGNPVAADALPTDPVQQALATLGVYFRAVNVGDFPTAVAQTVKDETAEEFADQVASSQDSGFEVGSAQQVGDRVVVWLTFTSEQDPGQGPAGRPDETCTSWSLDYTLVQHHGLWLVEASRAHDGEGSTPCA
ncbi:S1C family serine protease [Kineococcus rhizosphaerae]|uniref:Trypsin-like peptidase n=1 Tax=Kineococcus rhizosphaerae TaxID=559628 RepID=A0A2T0QZ75_9ACTN|nr:S1C family serine protease [Kineococcus rhizosphaerae]PRY11830.1 trypsin-like peptidase [Kineococcus rhizosphaerae]